ncbi:MAG: M23 family peptidase, partial [Bacteroides sp.]|nr:M23 family peptidase [Bacteroides sp.]
MLITNFRILLLCAALLTGAAVGETAAQTGPPAAVFRAPIDIKLFLSGNFGEVRSNHFHSGIDLKTEGQPGLPVHACYDGYVSRIKVEPGGYGNAVYLKHPNG